MNVLLILYSILPVFGLKYKNDVKIITHPDCVYSKALKVLLKYGQVEYNELNAADHPNLLKVSKKVPQLFLNGKLIGGYRNSIEKWPYIFYKIPNESIDKLKDPEFVIKKYGKKQTVQLDTN